MLQHSIQVMRFSRELSEQTEWFTVTWLQGTAEPTHVEHRFPGAERLKAWLLVEQEYSAYEVDTLIEQLRVKAKRDTDV